MEDRSNKRIVVTGANGNLGKAVIRILHQHGHEILAVTGSSKLTEACRDYIQQEQQVDLRDAVKAGDYVSSVTSRFGKIDAAVLIVGGYAGGKLNETSMDLIQQQVALNFNTAYNVVRPLLDHFTQQGGGQFVLIGSRPAIDPKFGMESAAYALSKGMVVQLGELINAFGKKSGIRATVIAPSTIDTPDNRKAMPGSDFTKWVKAEDIAEIIAFQLSAPAEPVRESLIKIYNQA